MCGIFIIAKVVVASISDCNSVLPSTQIIYFSFSYTVDNLDIIHNGGIIQFNAHFTRETSIGVNLHFSLFAINDIISKNFYSRILITYHLKCGIDFIRQKFAVSIKGCGDKVRAKVQIVKFGFSIALNKVYRTCFIGIIKLDFHHSIDAIICMDFNNGLLPRMNAFDMQA